MVGIKSISYFKKSDRASLFLLFESSIFDFIGSKIENNVDEDDYGQVQFTDKTDLDENRKDEEVRNTLNNELDIDFDEI